MIFKILLKFWALILKFQWLWNFTIDSSSEFAIRQFIIKYEDKTINQMKFGQKSKNEHIRRLAIEGSRPRLPWAVAFAKF